MRFERHLLLSLRNELSRPTPVIHVLIGPRQWVKQPETFAQPHKTNNFVIPAKAGIQYYQWFSGYRPSPV
jgi:hypothetical protein